MTLLTVTAIVLAQAQAIAAVVNAGGTVEGAALLLGIDPETARILAGSMEDRFPEDDTRVENRGGRETAEAGA